MSPDGEWLGFSADGQLKKVPLTGGTPEVVCDASQILGASWGTDDSVVFGSVGDGLFSVPSSGGTPERLTMLELEERSHRWPRYLPTGDVVFTVMEANNDLSVHVLSVSTGKRQGLIQGAADARYLPTGHLVFLRDGSLYSIPFDPVRLVTNGPPVVVVEGVQTANLVSDSAGQFDVADTGTLVYREGGRDNFALLSVDRQGVSSPLVAERVRYMQPRFSPDGKRLALLKSSTGNSDVWLYEPARGVMSRLTYAKAADITPAWSPDGVFVAFASNRDNLPFNLHRRRADGSGDAEKLSSGQNGQYGGDWSPDGKHIAFTHDDGTSTGTDVYVLAVDGDGEPAPFLATAFFESDPTFSPDGHFLAYMSDESGRYEVYVRPYPGPGAKTQVSTEGGQYPIWNPAGREIFYQVEDETDGDVRLMAVEYRIDGDTLNPERPRELFRGPFAMGPRAEYDVSPDGERFVMLRRKTNRTPLTFVVNWFDELKRLVPIQ
ncbi:MAG: hypothetical protein E2P02_06630 [Acidobacteria bacterium]|nr:MAG: hypothetical protein E2P02_06630 [Acidobacteriota bacterium]